MTNHSSVACETDNLDKSEHCHGVYSGWFSADWIDLRSSRGRRVRAHCSGIDLSSGPWD